MLRKLGGRHARVYFVYEAGPCGYGLYRQIMGTQHDCEVVLQAQTPRKPSDRIKTDRRDAITCSATGKIDPALLDALPEDRALARLSDASLTLALRAGTPLDVAARLSDLTRQASGSGPTLDDIEGYGEAEAAARRMVADLQGWSDGRIAWADVQRSVLLWGPPGTGKS